MPRQTPGSPDTRIALRLLATIALALLLAGCGAANAFDDLVGSISGSSNDGHGGATSTPNRQVKITTASVPPAMPGESYPQTTLVAEGGVGPVSWGIAGGALPPGMTLTDGGRVFGTPQSKGFFEFTAQASDGSSSDFREFAIAVDSFGVTVTDGLVFGDAWSGRDVRVRAAGQHGSVLFEVVGNGSGGELHGVDSASGTALWSAGAVGPAGALDVLRVTDASTGESHEIELRVVDDPTQDLVARFGSTDAWYLDWNARTGAHPYASDLHAALARLGLRAEASTNATGTEADRLADLLVRVTILRQLNEMFLREPDGTAGAAGLAISFALERPGDGYVSAAAGGWMNGRSNGYSVMAVCEPTTHISAMGMAYVDTPGNPRQEHNAPHSDGDLGIFISQAAGAVVNSFRLYGSDLRDEPVSSTDVPALKALLLGQSSPGGRYDMLRYHVEGLARVVSTVAAHEIGHSLGLAHTSTYIHGAVMNSTISYGPGIQAQFTAASLEILRMGLPGAGRGSMAPTTAKTAALGLPSGGVHVCGGCSEHLR